ncbi:MULTISPECIES: GNAT family N-acetyltransferase [unclassified Streptomyces]|uniref:GNAT family N-acetyltransferase n=1 Tax=unclassified Streptomyces TaxID=2593676 RepID=UPI0008238383|nr:MULTISPECIES: GNAT family N-acetyltransferase [unclassified Streptomyces]MYU02109.1 GNAT family N-acetyltransferase [Streptomyces sp. SID8350]SCK61574.1 Predicted acetyltransferase, GNAT family [Streptomyces sp. AmelKG-D3]
MRPNDWHFTEDLIGFLAQAGDFLHSRPALHTVPLTVTEALRTRGADAYGTEAPVFGWLERAGEVRAAFFRTPPRRLYLTPLTSEEADALAAYLAGLGRRLPGVSADHDTATAFAEAWQRHTGAIPTLHERERLYRLGTLTPPEPFPEGRGRVAGEQDREQLMLWHREFVTDIGGTPSADNSSWADTRIADERVTLWETPAGAPVSMAGRTPMVAGQIRVAPVYTPVHLRGRGYAGAATVEVSRAALAAGAAEVLLFADLANPTSNGLYQRIGYRPVADFAVYDF